MSKNLLSSWRPFLIVLLAGFLTLIGCEKTSTGLDEKDKNPPVTEPNPVLPLRSAVLPMDGVKSNATGEITGPVPIVYAVNGTDQLAYWAYGPTSGTGSYTMNQRAFTIAANGPYIAYCDSMQFSVAKYEGGTYKGLFGLQASPFGSERFVFVAIDGKQVAVITKTGDRRYFARSFEVDYHDGWIAGGARNFDNITILGAIAANGRVYYGLEYGGKYSVESNELRVLGDRQEQKVEESPLIGFDVDTRGYIFTCNKSTAAVYTTFGNRTQILSGGKDFRRISVGLQNGIAHVQESGFDVRVAYDNGTERKKIHITDPVPIIGMETLGNLADIFVTTAGVLYMFDWNTGTPKASPDGEVPQFTMSWPADFQWILLETIKFTEAKQ